MDYAIIVIWMMLMLVPAACLLRWLNHYNITIQSPNQKQGE